MDRIGGFERHGRKYPIDPQLLTDWALFRDRFGAAIALEKLCERYDARGDDALLAQLNRARKRVKERLEADPDNNSLRKVLEKSLPLPDRVSWTIRKQRP